jgi:carboxyvinyl-carboxyphosphonate phosphorylmutase
MTRWLARRERLRTHLAAPACLYPASVFDPVSVRIAEDLGYEVGMFAGSVASFTVLGAPDVIALTLSELGQQALRLSRAAELPIFVDADHGYGNAINVMRTVEELEVAGIAGLSIEDTELPQPFASAGQTRLISLEEGVGKMRAALAARRDPSMVIAGRTSAAAVTGIADAIRRAKAYVAAGVDVIFPVGITTRADLDAFAAEIKLPLVIGGLSAELQDRDYLASRGVRVCIRGHHTIAAATRAVYDTMKALREGTPPQDLKGLASGDLMKRVTRDADYARWAKDFLS